jgi:hypothetical protein
LQLPSPARHPEPLHHRPQPDPAAEPPVFAENLQALTFPPMLQNLWLTLQITQYHGNVAKLAVLFSKPTDPHGRGPLIVPALQ